MPTEREQMLRGAPYNSRDPELLTLAAHARHQLAVLHHTSGTDPDARRDILSALLGAIGEGVWIEPPFFCDYGVNIRIGAHTFINVNAVFLDSAAITIGRKVLIGPGVQLLTATHPLPMAERLPADWVPDTDTSPYVTVAAPITIGDGAWLGAGVLVMPGVTIGEGAVVGAGSVVTRDIPPHVLAVGNPCRVQRPLP